MNTRALYLRVQGRLPKENALASWLNIHARVHRWQAAATEFDTRRTHHEHLGELGPQVSTCAEKKAGEQDLKELESQVGSGAQ